MGKEIRLFKSKEQKTRADVSAFLHQLADKISDGKVVLSQGAKEVILQIPQNVVIEVQVEDEVKKTRGIQHSLEIELEWFDDDDQAGSIELK
ncbi:MAG: amphi-Trp domain-containing protein [Desulfobulbus sp.]